MTFSTETNRDCRYTPSLAAFLFYWRRVWQKRVSTKVMIDFHKVHVGQIPIGRTLERQVYRRSILPGHWKILWRSLTSLPTDYFLVYSCKKKLLFSLLEGSKIENSGNSLQKERRRIADEERLSPLKGFISLKGNNRLCKLTLYRGSFFQWSLHPGNEIFTSFKSLPIIKVSCKALNSSIPYHPLPPSQTFFF